MDIKPLIKSSKTLAFKHKARYYSLKNNDANGFQKVDEDVQKKDEDHSKKRDDTKDKTDKTSKKMRFDKEYIDYITSFK